MSLRVGMAETIITPPVGTELAGYAFGSSLGILDHLEAQALLLDDGHTQMALITADLLGFGNALVQAIRRRAQDELGIPGEHILLAASHTHSAPGTAYLRQWGPLDENYVNSVQAHLIGLLHMAQAHLAPLARLGHGTGPLDSITENRRGQAGLVDPAVPVLHFDTEAAPRAVLFSYGCHPVSLHSYGNLLSPDYPGYARRAIRDVLGQGTMPMFALGAAGDTNPAGYVAGETHPRRAHQIGAILGCEAAKIALDPTWEESPTLAVARETVALPLAPLPPPDELAAYRDQFAAEAAQLRAVGAPWASISVREIKRDWATDALRAWEADDLPDETPCEMMAARIGSAALLAVPLEVFAETGLAIRALSPAQATMICANSNGSLAYLPTQHAFQVDGDYANPQGLAPKVYGVRALGPGAEGAIRQAAGRLLQGLFRQETTDPR